MKASQPSREFTRIPDFPFKAALKHKPKRPVSTNAAESSKPKCSEQCGRDLDAGCKRVHPF